MKKFIIKIIGWALVIILFFTAVLYPLQLDFFANKKILYLEQYADKNLDLLVLGSSRAQTGFDPAVYGKDAKVFNIALGGHGLGSNYFLLKRLIKTHGFKIKTLLFQVDELSFNGSVGFSSKFKDDVFVKDLGDHEVYEAFETYRGWSYAYVLKKFPKLGNLIHNDFNEIIRTYNLSFMPYSKRIRMEHEKSIQSFADTKGYSAGHKTSNIERTGKKTMYLLEPDDIVYFQKIVQLCRENNIVLELYRAPILYCDEMDSRLFDQFIQSFSRDNNIPYYDYKCEYQYKQYYYDNIHFTDSLVQLFSIDLKNKVPIQDGVRENENISWKQRK